MTLWGFWKRWPAPCEVTAPLDRRPSGVKVHRSPSLARRDLRTQLGVRVTSPARTLLDQAPRLTDRALKRAVEDARLSKYLKLSALTDLIERCPNHPGARLLLPFTTTGDGPTRSPSEDDFPAFCERFGLPRPLMSTFVAGYEVDALFEAERLIVELDGWEFHSSRASFESDRERDANTLVAGYATVRITRRRTDHAPRKEAKRLAEILAARRPRPAV
jgi:hypothetical protein